jgi:hypothetical protein
MLRAVPLLAAEITRYGPGRIRTYDQGIHSAPTFPPGVDYLFTRELACPPDLGDSLHSGGCGMLLPVIKGARALR